MNNWVVFALVVVAFYDLFLEFTGRRTISEMYQALFPTPIDLCVLVAVAVGICIAPLSVWLKVLLGVLAGHIFWPNKERYRR